MSTELDDPKIWARLALALLIGVPFAALGFLIAMVIIPLFVSGWEAFLWLEFAALIFGAAGVWFGWSWLTRRSKGEARRQ